MKKILFLFLIIYSLLAFGQVNESYYPLIQNIGKRTTQSLNGHWNRLVDPLESGYYDYRKRPNPNGFFKNKQVDNWLQFKEYGFDNAPVLNVPGDWNTQETKLYYYEGTVWYKKSFSFSGKSARQFLYFGAVNYDAKVYLNGEKIGEHEGGYTPFNFEISKFIQQGENVLILKVDNKRRKDAIPTDNFDWWNYGGITRDVMLVEMPSTFIQDYKVQLKKGSNTTLQVQVKLDGAEALQKVKVEIPELKLNKTLVADAAGKITFEQNLKPVLWSPTNPKLYKVLVSSEMDKVEDEIGFRSIETKGNQILLNGKPVFLKGICVHEEAPTRTGRAFSLADSKNLLDMAQELGCNFLRLAHYPHNEFMVREAERRGILLWSEIPVYWTIDFENPATLANATNQLNEMISRDKNRASIIIWSVANETPNGQARSKFLTSLIQSAKAFDDTRLVSMALERSQINDTLQTIKDDMMDKVDVVSFNQYLGWYNGTWELPLKVKWQFKTDKPIIVSEFGGEALFGYHGNTKQRWTEEYQEQLYKNTCKMLDEMPNLVGVTPWILMDFRSSKRLLPGFQDDFNRKGLFSERGEPKKAMFVLKDWYSKK
jgi:beta-glucuronidase